MNFACFLFLSFFLSFSFGVYLGCECCSPSRSKCLSFLVFSSSDREVSVVESFGWFNWEEFRTFSWSRIKGFFSYFIWIFFVIIENVWRIKENLYIWLVLWKSLVLLPIFVSLPLLFSTTTTSPPLSISPKSVWIMSFANQSVWLA